MAEQNSPMQEQLKPTNLICGMEKTDQHDEAKPRGHLNTTMPNVECSPSYEEIISQYPTQNDAVNIRHGGAIPINSDSMKAPRVYSSKTGEKNSALSSSSFILGVANKLTAPLPPLPSLSWPQHLKPLPPFESLMPPITKKGDNTFNPNKISFALKANNSKTVPIATVLQERPATVENSMKYSSISESNYCKNVTKATASKLSLDEDEASMNSSSSLSIDTNSSSSASEDEYVRPHSRGSHSQSHRKIIPKYGEAKLEAPLNYDIMREILPKTEPSANDSCFAIKQSHKHGRRSLSSNNRHKDYKDSHQHRKRSKASHQLHSSHRENSYKEDFSEKDLLNYNELFREDSKWDQHNSIKSKRVSSVRYLSSKLKDDDKNMGNGERHKSSSKNRKYGHSFDETRSHSQSKYKHSGKYKFHHHKEHSDSASDRESGECSSTSSESDSEEHTKYCKNYENPLPEDDNEAPRSNNHAKYDPSEIWEDVSQEEDDHSDSYAQRGSRQSSNYSFHCDVSERNADFESDNNKSPYLSDSSKGSGKAVPLQKRLGLPFEETIQHQSNSNSPTLSQGIRVRKGPHTPDYPYEKSPAEISMDESLTVEEPSNPADSGTAKRESIKPTSIITKTINSIKGSTCNYTINHYKPTYSANKCDNKADTFKPYRQEFKSRHNSENSSFAVKSSVQTSLNESPVRSNLDARLKSMFGMKNSSSEDSPVKVDSVQKRKFFKPLRETPSPFRSRNTYLHWYKETYRFKKIALTDSYSWVDPEERIKIGIQIKEYSEEGSTSEQEQPLEDSCTLQDLGISPPRFSRVQQILNFDENELKSGTASAHLSKNALPPKVVKMTISPNSELELNCAPDATQELDSYSLRNLQQQSGNIMDLVVSKLMSDLKTSIKREITDDIIDSILADSVSFKKMKTG